MYRSTVLPLALWTVLLSASVTLAAPEPTEVVSGAEARVPTQGEVEADSRRDSVYGPIRSKDPLVRAEIKRLYLAQAAIHEEAMLSLASLNEDLTAETDPDFRFEISRNIGRLKRDLERRSMEVGLSIARLNEDAVRVADFERALDQVNHPEKYAPELVGPEQQAERIQAMESGVSR